MRKNFLVAVATSFILLHLLFLGNMCYLYATQFRDSSRLHNLNMLYVDFDGGVVGHSVLDAYSGLQAASFPTLQISTVNHYPQPRDVRTAVCRGDYWGAVYANANASTSLASTLAGGTTMTNSTALTYIWNGARYPAFAQSAIEANIMTLIEATRLAFYGRNASSILQSASLSNPNSLNAFLDPITATEINIKTTDQGTRVLYNTVAFVMPIIQQFFFMMALNGISSQFQVLTKLSHWGNGLLRMCISLAYTCLGALCMAGYIWAFRESWAVNGNQFVLCWMTIWLYMHINFLIFDILTTFVPMQLMPFCVLTWAIMNVASTISPFELNPGFFRWGYALPAHETYQILVQIWSNGCENQLDKALPVLFAWWVATVGGAVYSIKHRCHAALVAEHLAHQKAISESDSHSVTSNRGSRPSSTRAMVTRERWQTVESIRMENVAYGPRFPTPMVHGA
ncbi:nitrosoguanidine resistance protein SNG1 [Aspergillus ellipticus CBS 707.79]|uniref:Nitrosoguanidine resistance protein SNG1 n=1 Tax=Aspergillus ellipticus CBS 707.79 TaxID=1448320 RepID=A0A319DQP1_9EURO|nr:nitrosoguanidine resistance protein SNG1 [Aspergillus ellipticus CBS 707.79]